MQDQEPTETPLETLLVRYYEHHAKDSSSAEQARIALGYWSEFFAGTTVSDLQPSKIEDFISWLKKKGHSDGYINRTLSSGQAAMNRAHKRQEITSVPWIPFLKPGAPRERRLNQKEVAALLDAFEFDHLFMFAMLALNTLSRPKALLEMTYDQIDFEDRLINLNPAGRQQNKKYRPTVPMTKTLASHLAADGEGFVVSYFGRAVASVKKGFAAARNRAGLGSDVTPYTLRHTMATELRKRGVPPWEVAGMLGHKSGGYRTTEIYAKYDPDFLGKAVEAIDTYFTELDALTKRDLVLTQPELRASNVLVDNFVSIPKRRNPQVSLGVPMVGVTRIELVTPTMSRQGLYILPSFIQMP